jgi:hypothetical protein
MQELRKQLRKLYCTHQFKDELGGGTLGYYYVVKICPACQKKKIHQLKEIKRD